MFGLNLLVLSSHFCCKHFATVGMFFFPVPPPGLSELTSKKARWNQWADHDTTLARFPEPPGHGKVWPSSLIFGLNYQCAARSHPGGQLLWSGDGGVFLWEERC